MFYCLCANRSSTKLLIFVLVRTETFNPNRSLDRPMGVGLSFSHFPIAFVPLSASCLPPCLDVARYAFDKGDSQSARQQNEIALDSNDRFGFKLFVP